MTVFSDVSVDVDSDEPIVCYHCSNSNSETWYTTTRGKLCEDCGRICDNCDSPFNSESGSPHAYYNGEIYCYRCTRTSFFECPICNEWELNDNGNGVPNHSLMVCESCLESNYFFCDDCDEWIPDHWDHDECRSRNANINDYSYKPKPIFYHTEDEFDKAKSILEDTNSVMRRYKKIAYLGFELEVECNGDRNDFKGGADSLGRDERIWYLKSDGSLNYGFEIVSHPMTLAWAMDNLNLDPIVGLSDFNFEAWNASTAGFHVHVSRDGFESESHQARFVHFIMRNEEFLSWLAGRSASRWASFNPDHRKNLKNKLRNRSASDRYFAVNLQNTGTLEVRIFRASLKPERIKMALQLVDAIVNYTEKLSVSEMVNGKGFSAASFITWVSADSRYAVLTDYITRWLEPFESGSQQIGE
jgi:hypothetical protein